MPIENDKDPVTWVDVKHLRLILAIFGGVFVTVIAIFVKINTIEIRVNQTHQDISDIKYDIKNTLIPTLNDVEAYKNGDKADMAIIKKELNLQ